MTFLEDFDLMLQAHEVAKYSNCLRRQIGVVIPAPDGDVIWGANKSAVTCGTCHRETCSAVHAEVAAILRYYPHTQRLENRKLYIWAEVPCNQCLSFISTYSNIDIVYCLMPSTYAVEYPSILQREQEIKDRKTYAKVLGITIVELDREEVIEYELSKHSETDIQ